MIKLGNGRNSRLTSFWVVKEQICLWQSTHNLSIQCLFLEADFEGTL